MSDKATSLIRRILAGTLSGVPVPDLLLISSVEYVCPTYTKVIEYLKHNPESDIITAGSAVGFNASSIISDKTCVPPKTYEASLSLVEEFQSEVDRLTLRQSLKDIISRIDAGKNLDNVKSDIATIFRDTSLKDSVILSGAVDETVDGILDAHRNQRPIGAPFGIKNLQIDGIPIRAPFKRITTIGGQAKNGKSTILKSLIMASTEENLPCLMFSPEDQRDVFLQTIIASETGIPLQRIVYNKLNDEEISIINNTRAIVRARVSLVRMCDSPGITPERFLSISLSDYYDRGTKVFVFDYVQLAQSNNGKLDERQIINKTIEAAGYIANKTGGAVILASQLRRNDTEVQRFQRPTVQQLKGSGNFGERTKGPIILVAYPYLSSPDEYSSNELYLYIPYNSYGPPHPEKIVVPWNPQTKTIV